MQDTRHEVTPNIPPQVLLQLLEDNIRHVTQSSGLPSSELDLRGDWHARRSMCGDCCRLIGVGLGAVHGLGRTDGVSGDRAEGSAQGECSGTAWRLNKDADRQPECPVRAWNIIDEVCYRMVRTSREACATTGGRFAESSPAPRFARHVTGERRVALKERVRNPGNPRRSPTCRPRAGNGFVLDGTLDREPRRRCGWSRWPQGGV